MLGLGKKQPTEDGILDDLILMRAALDSGAGPLMALYHAGEDSQLLAPIISKLASGFTLEEIAKSWTGTPLLGRVLNTLAIAQEAGCSSASAIDNVMETIRQDEMLRANLYASSRDAAMTSKILSALPFMGLGMSALVGEANRRFLVSPLGFVLIAIVLTMVGLAALWMHRMNSSLLQSMRVVDPYLQACGKGSFPYGAVIGIAVGAPFGWMLGDILGMGLGMMVGGGAGTLLHVKRDHEALRAIDDGLQPTVSHTPTADMVELLSLAMQSGMHASTAMQVIAPYGEEHIAALCYDVSAGLRMYGTPQEAFPTCWFQTARIIDANQQWGAPVSTTLFRQACDLRIRAQEAAVARSEEIGTALSIPATVLLVPALMLAVAVPIMVPMLLEVMHTISPS